MRICLAMIVRNEAHIIRRCLESALPWIDAYAICDTGSSDGTQEVVREALAGMPGQVRDDEWEDFGTNRSLAMALARQQGCDYILMLDADEVLQVNDPAVFTDLTGPAYRVMCQFPGMTYSSNRLTRADMPWRYEGVIHEYPTCDEQVPEITLESVWLLEDGAGARGRDPHKMEKDIDVLELALYYNPGNARYWFYLAMTLMANNQLEKATNAFFRRAEMGDYVEEVFYSRLQIGQIHTIQKNWADAIPAYLAAYATIPQRAESLYWLALGYMDRKCFPPAILFLEEAVQIGKPVGALFLQDAVYDYLALLQLAVAYYWSGRFAEAAEINRALLAKIVMPDDITRLVRSNLAFCEQRLAELAA